MFNGVHGLLQLLGIEHKGKPTQQAALPKAVPVNGFQPLPGHYAQAKQYAANPDSFTSSGIDPRLFGYPADNSGRQLKVRPLGALNQDVGWNGLQNSIDETAPGQYLQGGDTYNTLQGSWNNPQDKNNYFGPSISSADDGGSNPFNLQGGRDPRGFALHDLLKRR